MKLKIQWLKVNFIEPRFGYSRISITWRWRLVATTATSLLRQRGDVLDPVSFQYFCCAFRCQLTFPSSCLIILITSVTALVMFTNLCFVLLSLLAGWLVSKVHLQLTKISQREAPGSVLWYSTLYQTIAECVISEIYYKVIYDIYFPEFPCFLLKMRTFNFFSRNTFKTGTILT